MSARSVAVVLALAGALAACAPSEPVGVTEPGAAAPVATATPVPETFEPTGAPTPMTTTTASSSGGETRTAIEAEWPSGPVDFCATITVPVTVSPAPEGRMVLLRARLGEAEWVTADSAPLDAFGRARLEVPGCDTALGAAANLATWKVELRGAGLPLSSPPARLRVSLPVMPGDGGTTDGCPRPRALQAEVSGPVATFTNPSPRCRMGIVVRTAVTCDYGGGTQMTASGLITSPIVVQPGAGLRVSAEQLADASGLMQQCMFINGGRGLTVRFEGPVRGAAFRFER